MERNYLRCGRSDQWPRGELHSLRHCYTEDVSPEQLIAERIPNKRLSEKGDLLFDIQLTNLSIQHAGISACRG